MQGYKCLCPTSLSVFFSSFTQQYLLHLMHFQNRAVINSSTSERDRESEQGQIPAASFCILGMACGRGDESCNAVVQNFGST